MPGSALREITSPRIQSRNADASAQKTKIGSAHAKKKRLAANRTPFRQLFGTDRYKMYRHGKNRKRNGGELKSIEQIAFLAVQNKENTRDSEFLVKCLACIAHEFGRVALPRDRRRPRKSLGSPRCRSRGSATLPNLCAMQPPAIKNLEH